MIFKSTKKFFFSPMIPGDKSISHRCLIFSALSQGFSDFQNLSPSEDVLSTQRVLSDLGVEISKTSQRTTVYGLDKKLKEPKKKLDCGNAGTLMRLMMGVLAGQKFESTLIGDESLMKRPMKRVQEPLEKMGANIKLQKNQYAPVEIFPSRFIDGAAIKLQTPSAQVKSAILLSALYAKNQDTVLSGQIFSRDHTERLLKYFGADIFTDESKILIKKNSQLRSVQYYVPNDVSAASFWITAAVLANEADVLLENVGMNPSRMGFVNVLKKSGANIEISVEKQEPEPIGKIRIRNSQLKAFEIQKTEIPSLIDEIPLLVLLASQAKGTSRIYGAEELRYKESDRLETTQKAIQALGGQMEIDGNDILVPGEQKLKGGFIKTQRDHRIAMMGAVARFCVRDGVEIEEVDSAKISDPFFIEQMAGL